MIKISKKIDTAYGQSSVETLLNVNEISSISEYNGRQGLSSIIQMRNGEIIYSYRSIAEIEKLIEKEAKQ